MAANNVVELRGRLDNIDQGGGGGDNGGMELTARVANLETDMKDVRERVVRIEGKVDHLATKSDVSEAINSQIKWMVGTALTLAVGAVTVITFVLNNATPKVTPSQPAASPPIIINVPASTAQQSQGK